MRLNSTVICVCLAVVATIVNAAEQRAYTGGHVTIEINGERPTVVSVEGGSAVGVVTASGTDKRINGTKYEDIVFSVPATSIPAIVNDALDGKQTRANGGIDYADFNYKGERRIGFKNAIVSAIRFPALDGASKDPAYVEVVLSPESTREEPPAGDVRGAMGAKQKSATANAFRVTIPGLETKRVASVSAIEVRAGGAASAAGAERFAAKGPGTYDVPNIKVTVSAADVKSWQQWLDQTLAEGGSKQEKTMRVELLEPNMKDPVLTLELSGVGIVAVRMKKAEANADAIQRAEVELYAEQVRLVSGGGAKSAAAEAAPADTSKTTETAAKEAAPAPAQKPIRRAR